VTKESLKIAQSEMGGRWVLRTSSLGDPTFVRAVGHWLRDQFGAGFELDGSILHLDTERREPIEGALRWLIGEVDRGRPRFDALGFASTHLLAGETKSGLTVLREAADNVQGAESRPEEIDDALSDAIEHGSSPERRLEAIGEADLVTTTEGHTDPASEADDPGRILERIGHGAPATMSAAPADLPEPDDAGRFDLILVDRGPDSERTIALVAAAIGVDVREARALCDQDPAIVARGASARTVRRIDTVVRMASGARFDVRALS
jgi:hypothetical protein